MVAFSIGSCAFPLIYFIFIFFDLNSANKNLTFVKDISFSDYLPTKDSVYYIETQYANSLRYCAVICSLATQSCAGVLYHKNTGTCHALKSRLYENSVIFFRKDVGWEYFSASLLFCDQGWRFYDGHCYLYVQTAATWSEAKEYCKNHGGYLATIETEEENIWIKETFLPAWNQDSCVPSINLCCILWIGANDLVTEGVFQWVNNKSLAYVPWYPHEPNNKGNEDCVRLCNNGQWNDENCSNPNNSICEKEL